LASQTHHLLGRIKFTLGLLGTQMRPIVTDRVSWSVGPTVCHSSERCENDWTDRHAGRSAVSCAKTAKTAEQIEMPFGLWTRVGPRKHYWMGPRYHMQRGNYYGKGHARACPTTLCCAKWLNWTDRFVFGVVD